MEFEAGVIGEKEFVWAQRRATIEVVAEMVAAGVEVISDGQIRWDDPASYICRALSGFQIAEDLIPVPVDRIGWIRPIIVDDFRFLSERSPVDVRPALTGPLSLALMCKPGIYGEDIRSLTLDLARALNRELQGLEAAGAKFVLLEEPLLLTRRDLIHLFTDAATELLREVKIPVMLETSHGDITSVARELLELPFGGYALDLVRGPDNDLLLESCDRWGDRTVQLDLIDTENSTVEDAEAIKLKLLRYAELYDPGLLWVGPCAGLGALPRDSAFEKLRSLHRGVQMARRELARQEAPGGRIP